MAQTQEKYNQQIAKWNIFLGSYDDLRKINSDLDLSDIILDMPKRGYKQVRKLNYLKHYK